MPEGQASQLKHEATALYLVEKSDASQFQENGSS